MTEEQAKALLVDFALWLSALEHPTHVGGGFDSGVILERVNLYLLTKESR